MVPVGLGPERAVVELTKATLPAVDDIPVVPVAFGVGKADPVVPVPMPTR